MTSSLVVDRMMVTRGSSVLYDEQFHRGVNIIHGSNGSGKSTLADFIFFGLGGDLRDWKPYASRADAVWMQVTTSAGSLTTRRFVSTDMGRPMDVFFGNLDDALEAPADRWQTLPYRRPDHGYSFSQVLFRAIGLPEAVSDGASNITMHQILRLLYADQLTPVQRIFRVENFDTWQTRQAVGELLAGIGGYELYDRQIELREIEKKYNDATMALRSLVSIAGSYGENILIEHVQSTIEQVTSEREHLLAVVEDLVRADDDVWPADIQAIRREAMKEYKQAKRKATELADALEVLDYEIEDADAFIVHLRRSLRDFDDAAATYFALGHLSFAFCPSCFAPVTSKASDHCQLCDTLHNPDEEDSRTLAVRLDLQMQLKESETLQQERHEERNLIAAALRIAQTGLRRATATAELDRVGTATGREAAVAELSRKVGFIDSQLENLQKRLELGRRIKAAAELKEQLNDEVTRLKGEVEATVRAQERRKNVAYTLISNEAKALLDDDLEEHSDFGEVTHVSFDFAGDWVAINGEKNRAGSASGMVILKNSFAAAMLFASLRDKQFGLPRWMLFDNIEDKGMVEERSWNFQRLLVKRSANWSEPHQIIFTTSKIAPELEGTPLVVGRKYTRAARSLA
jgi:predicted nucleic-acid-binding protein